MEKIVIGIVQKPFGIKGEVKIAPKTDFIQERFEPGQKVCFSLNGKEQTLVIASSRRHHGSLLVRFEGLDSLNDVEHYHRGVLSISRDAQHELPEDQFYYIDLEGCTVWVEGQQLGVVREVMEMPAHPVLRVEAETRDILIPFVDRFIKSVDKETKTIEVNWMEGL